MERGSGREGESEQTRQNKIEGVGGEVHIKGDQTQDEQYGIETWIGWLLSYQHSIYTYPRTYFEFAISQCIEDTVKHWSINT